MATPTGYIDNGDGGVLLRYDGDPGDTYATFWFTIPLHLQPSHWTNSIRYNRQNITLFGQYDIVDSVSTEEQSFYDYWSRVTNSTVSSSGWIDTGTLYPVGRTYPNPPIGGSFTEPRYTLIYANYEGGESGGVDDELLTIGFKSSMELDFDEPDPGYNWDFEDYCIDTGGSYWNYYESHNSISSYQGKYLMAQNSNNIAYKSTDYIMTPV